MMQQKCALQLYTLRDECKADFPNVLRELKRMGWAGVQFAGYQGYEPEALAEVMLETGLHIKYQRVKEELDQVIAEAQLFKTRDLVISSTPEDLRNASGYMEVRKRLNEARERLRQEKMRISYHNHAFEFDTTIEGRSTLEYLLEPTADNLLLAEIDVYWVKKGGKDLVSYLSPYSGRMPIIHLKDMTRDDVQTFAEIGERSIDFKPVLSWGERNGVEWYVVEQDRCRKDPMVCVQTSLPTCLASLQKLNNRGCHIGASTYMAGSRKSFML
ncbi:sugar phosphate isomerase/epimerase family protein [Paenibacillus periandrae]|uniref:sugar phosphate isomerase/epimerase family protein n=1 Tax=Paenibacillus periandrae TaxID=1761741 RepID=UPI001F09871A|nr:sugar phosphate isomerase/epimerase [Paenibacillus periandrae]